MSDDAETTTAEDSAQDSPGEKTYTQTQVESMIKSRLPELESYKAKAAQLDSLTESVKTASEKEADWKAKAESAESELAWRDTLLMRQEIAAAKGLDTRLWSRIKGETKEEIETDIGELQGFTTPPARRASSLKSGASAEGATTAKERAAQALRGIRDR